MNEDIAAFVKYLNELLSEHGNQYHIEQVSDQAGAITIDYGITKDGDPVYFMSMQAV